MQVARGEAGIEAWEGSILSRMGEKGVEDQVPATSGNVGRSRDSEPACLGTGGAHKAPARERTILGVAVPQQPKSLSIVPTRSAASWLAPWSKRSHSTSREIREPQFLGSAPSMRG
jgi:hypothetical protein